MYSEVNANMITEVLERAQFAPAKVLRRDEWQLGGFKHTWHHEGSRHAAGPVKAAHSSILETPFIPSLRDASFISSCGGPELVYGSSKCSDRESMAIKWTGPLRFLLHSFLPVAKTRVSLSTPGLMFNIQSKLCKCPACSNLDDGRRKQLLWAPIPCPLTPAVPGRQSLPTPPFASQILC